MESYKVYDDKLQKVIHGGLYTILLEKEERENEGINYSFGLYKKKKNLI